jgi:hypothetical protein
VDKLFRIAPNPLYSSYDTPFEIVMVSGVLLIVGVPLLVLSI